MKREKNSASRIFFYILAAIAFILSLSGVGSVIGIPMGVICIILWKKGTYSDY